MAHRVRDECLACLLGEPFFLILVVEDGEDVVYQEREGHVVDFGELGDGPNLVVRDVLEGGEVAL